MKEHPFHVGDKVVLVSELFTGGCNLNVVPQIVDGRLYCVEETSVSHSETFGTMPRVRLVGVRRNRRYHDTKLAGSLPAAYFRRVNGASSRPQQPKGGA